MRIIELDTVQDDLKSEEQMKIHFESIGRALGELGRKSR